MMHDFPERWTPFCLIVLSPSCRLQYHLEPVHRLNDVMQLRILIVEEAEIATDKELGIHLLLREVLHPIEAHPCIVVFLEKFVELGHDLLLVVHDLEPVITEVSKEEYILQEVLDCSSVLCSRLHLYLL